MRHCWLAATCLLLVTAAAHADDLPRNRGFEQARTGSNLPAGWDERVGVPATHRLSPEARSGRWAAEVTTTKKEVGYFYSSPEPLPATKRLTVSAWVRVRATEGGAYLKLYYLTGENLATYTGVSRQSDTVSGPNAAWQRLTISDVPPPDAQGWRLSVEFDGVGTALFDDAEAIMEPIEALPGVSLETPSGRVLDLGAGRRGTVWDLRREIKNRQLTVNLQGKSAVPPVCQVGAVWFAGARQLGFTSVAARAWQAPTGVVFALRPPAGADGFRPIVMTQTAAEWHAVAVGTPRMASAQPKRIAPAPLSVGPHPRLFIAPERLAALRQTLRSGSPPPAMGKAYAQLIRWADGCFDKHTLPAYHGASISLPPSVPPRHADDYPYWTSLSRVIECDIEVLATAYLLSGERRYADLAKSWTLALSAWPQWTDPDLSIQDCCLDTSHFCHAAASAYDFCYDTMTEAERKTIRDALLEKGAAAVMRSARQGWAKDMAWPNGFALVMGGMGIAGVATMGDDPRAAQYVRLARQRLHDLLSAQDRDGGYVEGLLYGGYAVSHIMPFAGTLAVHGDRALVDHPYLGKTLRMACQTLQPGDSTTVNFCDSIHGSRDYGSLAAWRAMEGDAAGVWYLEKAGLRGTLHQWTPPLPLLWEPNQQEAEPPVGWPLAAHYRDIGWVVMRSGFDVKPAGFGVDDIMLALRCGYMGSHCQPDNNSFMLNTGKQWLLSDPGYGVYDTSRHSTLLVDGQGQSSGPGEMAAFGQAGLLTYAAGDATASYPALSRFVRHFIMVGREYVVVVDEIAARDKAQVTSQVVTGLEKVQIVDGNLVELAGQAPWMLLYDPPVRVEAVGGSGPKTLRSTFAVGKATTLRAMVLAPSAARGVGTELEVDAYEDAVGLYITRGATTDYLMLNITGKLRTRQGLTSDARVAFVRTGAGPSGGEGPPAGDAAAMIWGSQLRFGERLIKQATSPCDFSTE